VLPRRQAARAALAAQARANEYERIIERKILTRRVAPAAVLESAGLDAALTHDHAMRNPQKLGIRKFDAGAGIAVVEEYSMPQLDSSS